MTPSQIHSSHHSHRGAPGFLLPPSHLVFPRALHWLTGSPHPRAELAELEPSSEPASCPGLGGRGGCGQRRGDPLGGGGRGLGRGGVGGVGRGGGRGGAKRPEVRSSVLSQLPSGASGFPPSSFCGQGTRLRFSSNGRG